jgi:NADP-dependent 3-hydroxy acid dehydrogenase YdfG
MAGSLADKVAIVTGATAGIGEATALSLAAEGAAVALAGRREERLTALKERIEAAGGRALAIKTDVGDEAQCNALVERTNSELGGVDILINNAGVMLLGPVMGADTEEWRRMFNANVFGLLYCTHAALPLMADKGSGHIVNVASTAGRHANMGSGVYNFTKFGVVGFSEALRQEALHVGVRVTIIEPGMVETELVGHNTNPVVLETFKKFREQVGEPLESEDIAAAILYAVTQPQHVSINEMLIRPTKQLR